MFTSFYFIFLDLQIEIIAQKQLIKAAIIETICSTFDKILLRHTSFHMEDSLHRHNIKYSRYRNNKKVKFETPSGVSAGTGHPALMRQADNNTT